MALNPITQLMQDWRAGAEGAEAQLLKMVYPAMKEIAGRQLRHAKQFTLRPTELANDVFMQMRKNFGQDAENSTQFYALAAHMIRCIVVDHIREVQAQKRGSQFEIVTLEFASAVTVDNTVERSDWLALDCALNSLFPRMFPRTPIFTNQNASVLKTAGIPTFFQSNPLKTQAKTIPNPTPPAAIAANKIIQCRPKSCSKVVQNQCQTTCVD